MESGVISHTIVGRVKTGLGRATGFTSLPWVKREIMRVLGIDPFPGTLNLQLDPQQLAPWQVLADQAGLRIDPERSTDCGARCFPVLVTGPEQGPVTAGILLPEVPGYPPDQVEVVAAIALRESLRVADGSELTLRTVPVRRRRAVLFDVDGTLVNSIDGYRLAAQRAVAPYGWSVSDEAVKRSLNFGEQFWDLVVPGHSAGDPALIARLRQDTMAHWPAILEDSVLVYPGIGPMLHKLKAAGIRLGICTASRGESFRPLERSGLLSLFDEVVTARDVVRRKPDPEGLLLCLERMAVDPAETVYIGDTVADISASHSAGLFAVGVLTGAGDSALLSAAGAHRILPDLQLLAELLLGDGVSQLMDQ